MISQKFCCGLWKFGDDKYVMDIYVLEASKTHYIYHTAIVDGKLWQKLEDVYLL